MDECCQKNPKVLILDESTNQLDEQSEIQLIKRLITLDKTIIFITHNSDISRQFDKVYKIERKNLIKI